VGANVPEVIVDVHSEAVPVRSIVHTMEARCCGERTENCPVRGEMYSLPSP
jgi:hypothetical protein